MRLTDMLALSLSNLFKRKVRTILTILGVVIGVASIVVMVSLGLGLNRSVMEEMQNYVSLTEITVNPGDTSAANEKDRKYLTEDLIDDILQMEHVEYVAPQLQIDTIGKFGAYSGYLQLVGTSLRYLNELKIDVGQGRLPEESDRELQLFYGNMVIQNFNTKNGKSYWETGVLPDVDPMRDSIMYILDTEKYYAFQNGGSDENGTPVRAPKKHLFSTCGMAAGGMEDWHPYSFSVYCDIEKLIPVLKKEFKNSVIPGQPTRKNGKAYKEIYYNQLIVICDDMENVSAVDAQIRNLGYNTYNDSEWIQSQQQQMNMIEAVLGGIGAVSLLVAAIGIANTMMMSIYERTKEIGVMKVLGCDIRNIQAMFLMEAGFIGLIGGVIGLALSFGLSAVLNVTMSGSELMGGTGGEISYIPFWLAGLSLVFAVVVGMISGFFPSRRAMKLSPLAAIHNE